MEDSPNGRVEETQKVEVPDDEKEVDGEEAGDQKYHDESEREIVIDENSEPVNKACDGDDSSSSSTSSDEEVEGVQNSPDLVDDSKISQEEKEIPIIVIESIEPAVSLSEELTDAVEPPGEKSGNSDITELDSKEIEENITQSLDQTNGVSPVIKDVVSNGAEEKTPPSSDETKGICPAVTDYAVSRGIEEAMLQSLDEYGGVSSNGKDVASKGNEEFQAPDENRGAPPIETQLVLKGIEETTVHYVDENNVASPAVTDFKSKGIEETKSVDFDESKGETSGNNDFASKNSVDELLQVSANVPAVGTIGVVEHENKHEISESAAENPPIISLRQRTMQPTSWRSCCGLLEVLRRNR